jgi:hypothetical protein
VTRGRRAGATGTPRKAPLPPLLADLFVHMIMHTQASLDCHSVQSSTLHGAVAVLIWNQHQGLAAAPHPLEACCCSGMRRQHHARMLVTVSSLTCRVQHLQHEACSTDRDGHAALPLWPYTCVSRQSEFAVCLPSYSYALACARGTCISPTSAGANEGRAPKQIRAACSCRGR